MNKRFKILIFLCMVFNSAFIFANDINTIRIGSTHAESGPRPPYKWQKSCTAEGEATGSYPHLLEIMFRSVGKTIEWMPAPKTSSSRAEQFEKQYERLLNGEYDFLVSTRALEDEYSQLVSLDVPLFTRRSSIIYRVNNPINSSDISILKSYTAGVFSSDSKPSPLLILAQSLHLPVKTYSDESSAFADLMAEKIDYVINDHYMAKVWSNKHKVDKQLVFKDITVPARSYYLIVAADSNYRSLMGPLNQELVGYNQRGLIKRLHDTYMKRWVSDPCL